MHRTVHTARVWRDRDQIPLKMVPRYTLSSTRANGQLRRVPRAQRARTRTEAGVDQGSLVPERIERAGVGPGGVGSISAFYTVLAEGDDRTDPIVDLSRATLDGQIMLSRALADAAHYPAIDLEGSISRVASSIIAADHFNAAQKLRKYWSLYVQKQDLIQVGAYTPNTDPELDEAIRLKPMIDEFLRQDSSQEIRMEKSIESLQKVVAS